MVKAGVLLLVTAHAVAVDKWVELESGWDYNDIDAWISMEGVCSASSQSPIDIRGAKESEDLPALPAHGGGGGGEEDDNSAPKTLSANLISNAHSFEAVVSGQRDLFITWEGKKYYLDQFHYHSPSEHTINGRFYDMEAHHVHKADDGQALVLAVMMDATHDNANSYMKEMWSSFPKNIQDSVSWQLQNPYTGFLPKDTSYYKYDGSFTTPPCTEDTHWLMLTKPVQISVEQREYFRDVLTNIDGSQMAIKSEVPKGVALPWRLDLGTSNRPVQDLNGRKIRVTEGDDAVAV